MEVQGFPMELNPAVDRLLKSLAAPLANELKNILEEARTSLEAEIQQRIQKAVSDAAASAQSSATQQIEVAVAEAQEAVRKEVTEELSARAEGELQAATSRMKEEARVAAERWASEKYTLTIEAQRWKQFGEFHSQILEVTNQGEALTGFLRAVEGFAEACAVYVSKPEGLTLWRSRGDAVKFPAAITAETANPQYYFAPVVLRAKTVAAIVAAPDFDRPVLDRLVAVLARGIEGIASQIKATRAAAPQAQAGSSRAAARSAENLLSDEEEQLHVEACKHARLLISEIKLYHETEVRDGRVNSDLYERLRADIDKARAAYRHKVAESVASRRDYFHEELVRILAVNDPTRLGTAYLGPMLS